jgi:hypothetical protein
MALGLAALGVLGAVGPTPADATFAAPELGRPEQKVSQLLGIVDERLVRVDLETLRPVPGRAVFLGFGGCAPRQGGTACWSTPAWSVAPSGERLAIAANDVSSLRIVDVGRMRVASRTRWGNGGSVGALAWLAAGRVLAVQEAFGERQRLVVFDVPRKRVVARRALGGTVVELARAPRELALLVAPEGSIGPARLAVVDARGGARFAQLDRIVAGSKLLGSGSEHRVDVRRPGLAVDPAGGRAFVVAQQLVAEIDLRTLAVSYHELERPRSLLSRLRSWLEPVASAKQVSGYHRQARWLGSDLLAVAGDDTEDGVFSPAGLELVDTRTWSVRTIEPGASRFEVGDGVLLATGGRWDAVQRRSTGIGLSAYRPVGQRAFQLFDGEWAGLAQVYGNRAYVLLPAQADVLHVVELATGRLVGTRAQPLPTLLLGAGSGWWG